MSKALIKDNATPLHTVPPFQLRCNLMLFRYSAVKFCIVASTGVIHSGQSGGVCSCEHCELNLSFTLS